LEMLLRTAMGQTLAVRIKRAIGAYRLG